MKEDVSENSHTLMVARNLEKALGLLAFSVSAPSSVAGAASFFLLNAKGKEDLRLSDFTSFLVSPLVTGDAGVTSVVSTGTVAGLVTSVLRGSEASGAGMTGAFSLTASGSFAGTAGAAGSSEETFFLLKDWPKDNPPKMLQ